MRVWFSGPRIMGIRTGISLGREDFKQAGKVRSSQRSPGRSMEGGFVYAIRGEHNRIKVGASQNPNARLADLQTASPFQLEFCFIGACQTSGIEIEREAHRLLEPHRTNGEWFDCSAELASSAIFGAAAKLGQKIAAVPPNMVDTVIACTVHPELLSTGAATFKDQEKPLPLRIVWSFYVTALKVIAALILGCVLAASFSSFDSHDVTGPSWAWSKLKMLKVTGLSMALLVFGLTVAAEAGSLRQHWYRYGHNCDCDSDYDYSEYDDGD